MTEKKFLSFRSECLEVYANEHCYGDFQYNCEANDRNVSLTKISQQKMTEMSQRKIKQCPTIM